MHHPKSFSSELVVKKPYNFSNDEYSNTRSLVLYFDQPPLQDLQVLVLATSFTKLKGNGYAGLTATGSLESFTWNEAPSQKLKLSMNGTKASVLTVPADSKQAYRFVIDSPHGYALNLYSKEQFLFEDEAVYLKQRCGLFVIEGDGSYQAQAANNAFLLLRQTIAPSVPVNISFLLDIADEFVKAWTRFSVFDIESGQEIKNIVRHSCGPFTLNPAKNGYMVLAYCRSVQPVNPGKYRLRIIHDTAPITNLEQPTLSITPNPTIVETDDLYIPNRKHLLMRYLINRKETGDLISTLQFQFNVAMVNLTLQILDNENVIHQAKGRGVITIPFLQLYREGDKPSKYTIQVFADEKDMINQVLIPYTNVYNSPELPQIINKYRKNTVPQTADKKKKDKNAAVAEKEQILDMPELPAWKLRILIPENTNLTVVRDTEKDDIFKSIKAKWETEQPGRALKAKEIREEYIKSANNIQLLATESMLNLRNDRPPSSVLKPVENDENRMPDVAVTTTGLRNVLDREPFEYMTAKRRSELWGIMAQSYTKDEVTKMKSDWRKSGETIFSEIEKTELLNENELLTASNSTSSVKIPKILSTEVALTAQVISPQILEEKQKERQNLHKIFEKYQEKVQFDRQQDRESRTLWNETLGDKIVGVINEWKTIRSMDNQRRSELREGFLKKEEDAIQQAAEDNNVDKEKSASAGKKNDKKKPAAGKK